MAACDPVTSRRVAPDGGWGWLVLVGSFVTQGLSVGITYTFGILFVDLLAVFQQGESVTAWIGSIQPALLYLTGAAGGPLLRRYGWRRVAMMGATLSAAGCGTSALAPNVYVLYLTYGVLTGLGFGLMFLTALVVVQHWFDRRRAMATGLAVAGSGIGTLSFGFIIPALLDSFGWRYTLAIEGAIIFILGVPCAALFRPLPEAPEAPESPAASGVQRPLLGGDRIAEEEEDAAAAADACASDTAWESVLYGSTACSSPLSSPSHTVGTASPRHDAPSSPDPTHTPGPSHSAPGSSRTSSSSSPSGGSRGDPSPPAPPPLRNPVFILLSLTMLCFALGYHVPYMYLPERAEQMFGLTQAQSSLLVAVMGIANVAGRLVNGFLGDRTPRARFYIFGAVLAFCGLTSGLVFLFVTFTLMMTYSALFGFFAGGVASLFPVLLVDLLGIDTIDTTIGQCMAITSISFLFAAPASGYLVRRTGSFDVPFMACGVSQMLGASLLLPIRCVIGRWPHYHVGKECPEAEVDGSARRGRRRKRYYSQTL